MSVKLVQSPMAYGAMATAVLLDLYLLFVFFKSRRMALAAA
jgi:hypothetical protein